MQLDSLIKFRKEIHSKPDLSNEEGPTAERVADYLSRFKPDTIQTGLGGTGVMATFDSGQEGPTILIRAELDALPIQEVNRFSHKSSYQNKSHMCGHDGHLTILLGLAERIRSSGIQKGKVHLLFQPGEENGTGAKAVIEDLKDADNKRFDYVVALHNLPGYEQKSVVVRDGAFTAYVISAVIKLNGKTSHAAEPELGHNPATVVARILTLSEQMTNNTPADEDFFLVTPVHVRMGEVAYGISAGQAEVHLTLRAWNKEELNKHSDKLIYAIRQFAEMKNIDCEIEWTHEFYANINNSEVVETLRSTANQNNYMLVESPHAFKWGEDFGLFTQRYKGAMFGIGSGKEHPALHNPDYDFPDEIIPVGVDMFYGFIDNILNS